jgi:predicted phage terminase large subunit-like protein
MSKHDSRLDKLEKDQTSKAPAGQKIPRDPVEFAKLLKIEPDPWQRDLLTSKEKRIILNCARQSGKSTIVAIRALHHALTNRGSLVLILSPTQRQSGLLFEKIVTFHKALGRRDGSDVGSATTLRLKNESRIESLPGSEPTIRGYSAPSLVLIDEAAQVTEELYYAVTPMFATSEGQLILLSTPRGRQGIFWHAWDQEPDWKRVNVTADQCPRISKEFLDQQRRALPTAWFNQEFCCEFAQDDASIFKEVWVQYYDPDDLPHMDRIIQSWDTAQTKSSTSSYVVGQVWGSHGADFYLLDQVRGRYDFDETVRAIQDLSSRWLPSTAKLVEAQALGAAVVTHLKPKIAGLIPITVKDSKKTRALDCVPVWQSKNVYIPKPDNGKYAWVYEYVQELLNFPNVAHDDQVDATTLALNQLYGSLFRTPNECVADARDSPPLYSPPLQGHYYFIGWVPGRSLDMYTVLVFDRTENKVVHFGRFHVQSLERQIKELSQLSRHYNRAVVRAFDRVNGALTSALEARGVWVERVKFSKLEDSYENLAILREGDMITIPAYPELQAEMDVFKSDFTFDGNADYNLQVAQQSGIHALCLVTYDLSAELIDALRRPSVYYNYDPDLI